MDQEKLEYFKEKLTEELEHTKKELDQLGVEDEAGEWDASVGNIDESATEPDELADRVEEYEEDESELSTISKHHKDILRALERIEDGSYGICEVGGEEIEEDRLEANPSARTCKAHMEQEGELSD